MNVLHESIVAAEVSGLAMRRISAAVKRNGLASVTDVVMLEMHSWVIHCLCAGFCGSRVRSTMTAVADNPSVFIDFRSFVVVIDSPGARNVTSS